MLAMLMAPISSSAQKIEDCFTPKQLKHANDYRKECEKCRLDLTDTMVALKESREREGHKDHSTTIVVGVGLAVLGYLLGSINK